MILSVSNLSLTRGDRTLFRALSLDLAPGEAIALTGPNGAGKTSLLRAVAGFIRPAAGTVTVAGDAETPPASRLHLLGHLDGLKGHRTAGAELDFQARWLGASDAALAHAIDRLHLAPLLDLEVRKLSAGQRRRLAFARLIAAPRPLWLLDEPLAPLDAGWRASIGGLMTEHLASDGAILAAVHDPLPVPTRDLDLEGLA